MSFDRFDYADFIQETIDEANRLAADHFQAVVDILFSDDNIDLKELYRHLEEVGSHLYVTIPNAACNIVRKQSML